MAPGPGRPAGHLRYWDGRRWTEAVATPPSAAAGRPCRTPHRSRDPPQPARRAVRCAGPRSTGGSPRQRPWSPSWPSPERSAPRTTARSRHVGRPGRHRPGPTDPATAPPPTPSDAVEPAADASTDPAATGAGSGRATPAQRPPRTYLVTRIIDGDTLELGNDTTVRLVGVDTPEVGECGSERATALLGRLVLGERVVLRRSDEDRDRYGRLLRYVDLTSGPRPDAGMRLIDAGLAVARYDSRDGYGAHPRERSYVAADRAARDLACRTPARCAPRLRPRRRAPRATRRASRSSRPTSTAPTSTGRCG